MSQILITSSVLILALLLLRLIFAQKVSRRLIYGAWVLVALRLLIPVQIGQLDFSVLTLAQPVMEAMDARFEDAVLGNAPEISYQEQVQSYIEKDQSVFIPEVQAQIKQEMSQGTQSSAEIYGKLQEKFPQQEILTQVGQEKVYGAVGFENAALLQNADTLAVTVWLVGIAVMAVWFAVINLRHSRSLRRGAGKLDCDSPIPVYQTENAASPCLMGLLRPAVYLTTASTASEESRRHVLTHELTHYRHGDHIWALVRCVCLCVYWFHPLVWVAAWVSRRDCEMACDEGALSQLGEGERIAYGRTLLEVVSHAATPAGLLQTATAMAETKKQLKERVHYIARKPKLSGLAAVCMVLLCLFVTGCAVTGPAAVSMDDPLQPPVDTDVPAYTGRFAMYDQLGWVELGDGDTAMFHQSTSYPIADETLLRNGLEVGPAVCVSIYRYSGTCVKAGDTYTLTVEKVERAFELQYRHPQALAAALAADHDSADYEKMYRGEYVECTGEPVTKVVFRMEGEKVTYLEVYHNDALYAQCDFYANGNTKTLEVTGDSDTDAYRAEYYETGLLQSYRREKSDSFYLETYNQHGDLVSSGEYRVDYRLGGHEYEYEYYQDGTKKQSWDYSVGEGASVRRLECHVEYYPDGSRKTVRAYYGNGNLEYHWQYDERGCLTLSESYYADGTLESYRREERVFSELGVMLDWKTYDENGTLLYHEEYYETGVKKSMRMYYADGQLQVHQEYDAQGNTTRSESYNWDGSPL